MTTATTTTTGDCIQIPVLFFQLNNSLFSEPSGPNVTLNVFNVTVGVTTDVEFRCLDQATAFSGVTHNLFKSVCFYEFNRSYQTPGFDPNVRTSTSIPMRFY